MTLGSPLLVELRHIGATLAGDFWQADRPRGCVLLLHGGGQTRASWARTARRLQANGWNVAAFDARGHGASGWIPDGNYEVDGFVSDVAAAVDWIGEAPVIVGASLGGWIALVAQGERELGRALVLVDIAINPAQPSVATRAAAVADDTSDSRFDRRIASVVRGLDPERARAAAVAVRVPTLIMRGSRSDIVSDQAANELVELVSGASRVDVAGAGHLIVRDRNETFSEHLDAFLAGAGAGAKTEPRGADETGTKR